MMDSDWGRDFWEIISRICTHARHGPPIPDWCWHHSSSLWLTLGEWWRPQQQPPSCRIMNSKVISRFYCHCVHWQLCRVSMEDDSSLLFINFDFDVHQNSQYLERVMGAPVYTVHSSGLRALITKPSIRSIGESFVERLCCESQDWWTQQMTLVCGLQRTVSSSSSVSTIRSSVSSSSSVTRRSLATSGTSSRQTKQSSSSSVTEVKRALQSCSIQDNIGGRGRYSVNIQFNRDNNVKMDKIVWQSMKHVHYLWQFHNILAIIKSPVSDYI